MLAIAMLILTAGHVMAQEMVVPKEQLPLRAAPPGIFFQGKGNQIGSVSPNEQYVVLDKRWVPTIAGAEQWLRVQSVADRSKQGWIYGGKSGRPSYEPAPAH